MGPSETNGSLDGSLFIPSRKPGIGHCQKTTGYGDRWAFGLTQYDHFYVLMAELPVRPGTQPPFQPELAVGVWVRQFVLGGSGFLPQEAECCPTPHTPGPLTQMGSLPFQWARGLSPTLRTLSDQPL